MRSRMKHFYIIFKMGGQDEWINDWDETLFYTLTIKIINSYTHILLENSSPVWLNWPKLEDKNQINSIHLSHQVAQTEQGLILSWLWVDMPTSYFRDDRLKMERIMHDTFNAITSPNNFLFCFENNDGWPRDESSHSIPRTLHPQRHEWGADHTGQF